MKTKKLLLSLLALFASIGVNAYDFKVNGIYYHIWSSTAKTVEVTYQNRITTSNVPSGYYYKYYHEIDGYDDEGEPIYGAINYYYYTSDYSGSITIPNTVTYNGTTYQVIRIGENAFNNCNASSITIPSAITSMGYDVFQSCI